jgi:hypothetical protein
VLKISQKIRVLHSRSVQAILRLCPHPSHSNQPVHCLFQEIIPTAFLWVGPNPQVFSQDLTWLF